MHWTIFSTTTPQKAQCSPSLRIFQNCGFVYPEVVALFTKVRFPPNILIAMEQSSRKKKLSKQEERELIDKHKIKFEGPVSPASWPEQNSAIFTSIRKIEDIKYNTYLGQIQANTPEGTQRAKTVDKANRLVSAAYDCRVIEANEFTWRSKTEFPLLARFEEDIEW
jgi:hypothetical protein